MKLTSMKSSLRAYERKVFLGVSALAGAGATAAVAKWQQGFGDLAATRDQFIAATGEQTLVSNAYNEIASTLDALGAVVSTGNKEAIMEAGMRFYATLGQAHETFARLVPAEVRGVEKPPEETVMRVSTVLRAALGL